MAVKFYKRDENEKIWWVDDQEILIPRFSFDKKKIYNIYSDYPDKLTKEEKELFDKENPYWAETRGNISINSESKGV